MKKITAERLVDLSFIFFLDRRFVITVFGLIGLSSVANKLIILIIYLPILTAMLINRRAVRIKKDILLLIGLLIVGFSLTYLLNSSIREWYFDDRYGLWEYVFLPIRGIYAYLFIRLINTPKRLERDIKIAGVFYFIESFILIYRAMRSGGWNYYRSSGDVETVSYNLTLGYGITMFLLFYLHSAITEKNKKDIMLTMVGFVALFMCASRGPILLVAALLIIELLRNVKIFTVKGIFIYGVIIAFIGAISFYINNLLVYLGTLLSRFNISLGSKLLTSLVNGNIDSDSGREQIWGVCKELIAKNPFGYGFMGSRQLVYDMTTMNSPYPHSIIYEFILDYGVILGPILLFVLAKLSFNIMKDHNSEWSSIYVPMFSAMGMLFLSSTYWVCLPFWICIGIIVNYYTLNRRQRVHKWNRKSGQNVSGQRTHSRRRYGNLSV